MDVDPAPCPVCGSPLAAGSTTCSACGTGQAGPEVERIREIEAELWRLGAERKALVERLRNVAVPPPTPSALPAHAPAPQAAPVGAHAADTRPTRFRDVSAQTVLAAAGVVLLALAAVVFTAVTWQRLGALTRTALLLAVTGVAAAGARTLVRRRLRITGEAVAVLAVVLALVDVHGGRSLGLAGLDDVPTALYVAVTSVLLAALAVAFSRWAGVVAAEVCAVLLLLVAAPALAVHLGDVVAWERTALTSVVMLPAAVGLEVLRRSRLLRVPAAGHILRAGSVAHWLVAVTAAAYAATAEEATAWVVGGVVVGALAVTAAWADRGGAWTDVLAGAAGAVVATIALTTHADALTAPLAAGAVAGGYAVAVVAAPAVRRTALAAGALPLAAVVWTAALALGAAITGQAGDTIRDAWAVGLLAPVGEVTDLGAIALLAGAATIVAWALDRPRLAGAVAVVGAAGSILALTAVAGGPPLVRVAVGLGILGLVAAAAHSGPIGRGTGPAALVLAAWTLPWALASDWLTVGALVGIALFAGVMHVAAADRLAGVLERGLLLGLAVAASLAVPGTMAGALGAAGEIAGAVTVLTAAVVIVAASLTLRRGGTLVVVELVVATATVVGLGLASDAPRVLAFSFAAAGVGAAIHALRPGRRRVVHLATLLFSATTWTLLADADVTTVEAYTAAPALLTLLAGGWRLVTDPQARSLPALTAGLGLALGPTAIQLLADPTDLVRAVALAGAGTLALVLGAYLRLSAPVVHGAGAIGVVALTQLAVAASHLPRWVTFATLGLLLVFVSATYEQQRARLAATRRRVADIR